MSEIFAVTERDRRETCCEWQEEKENRRRQLEEGMKCWETEKEVHREKSLEKNCQTKRTRDGESDTSRFNSRECQCKRSRHGWWK